MSDKQRSRSEALYREIENAGRRKSSKPCIGLSVNVRENLNCIADSYIDSVVLAGGIPVLIPVLENVDDLTDLLDKIDGLILSGGGDIDPSFFNEELQASPASINESRDAYDLKLIKLATDRQIPVLGICRGFQVLNVAFGGNLYQDIPAHYPYPYLQHDQTEPRSEATQLIRIEEDSLLFRILDKKELEVNTFHHQAIKEVAPVFRVSAKAEDGIVEAFESNCRHAVWGVQFHPECMAVNGNEDALRLFRYFIGQAEVFQRAKKLHREIVSIDSHCDTPMFFEQGVDIAARTTSVKIEYEGETFFENSRVSLPKMQEGMLDAVFMVAYLRQEGRDAASTRQAVEKTKRILSELRRQIEKNKDRAGLACTSADILRLKEEGKKAILMGIENAYGLGNDLKNLALFQEMGTSYITLCHNGHNDVCDSASEAPEHNGLSDFGREVVREMNRLGIMIDISHTSEKTSYDVLALSKYPIIASHSSVKALCDHRRNLSDDLMKEIASKGGVVQICLYDGFLSRESVASIADAVEHIDYAVRLVGVDHVGVGSDFDGGGGILGLNAANEMINLTMALLQKTYSEADIRKIWGGNLMRVMDCVQNR